MDAVAKFGSAHGSAVRTGALKVIVQTRLENNMGSLSFGYFPLAVQRKVTRLQAKPLLLGQS